MALHDYTLTHPKCKSSFPYCTDILQDTHNLKPYMYLQINTRGVAIKALSIFMDYVKWRFFYLNQFCKAIGSQIQVDYN